MLQGRTAGASIEEHMDVDKVAFTGSTEVCYKVVQPGRLLKNIWMWTKWHSPAQLRYVTRLWSYSRGVYCRTYACGQSGIHRLNWGMLQGYGLTAGASIAEHLRNKCLFFWVHGVWIVAWDKQIAWTAKRFSGDLFVPRYDSYPMNPEKRHSFLIFTMFPTRTLSKILREKLLIQNSHSNGHLTSFNVLITMPVIRLNCRTFCWLCSSGNELKNFSRVQWRKYDTIVNIWMWTKWHSPAQLRYVTRSYSRGVYCRTYGCGQSGIHRLNWGMLQGYGLTAGRLLQNIWMWTKWHSPAQLRYVTRLWSYSRGVYCRTYACGQSGIHRLNWGMLQGRTAGASIEEHMDVDKVAFTGSTEVCYKVVQPGRLLKNICMWTKWHSPAQLRYVTRSYSRGVYWRTYACGQSGIHWLNWGRISTYCGTSEAKGS